MSKTIDTRVVEMRFDNKQFEEGVKESLGTLKKLKETLDKGISGDNFKQLEKAANSINFKGIAAGVDFLADRFSVLGIVGMRVIENITDGLMNTLVKGINFATDAIVSGGVKRAMNIENAHFQLQGLIDDEKEVQAIMDDASESVNGTAYAYDSAAKAASMFAATGIRSGREMQIALKAIAGVAATTNSDYESLSQIFTTISGQGRVMADQLNQLANRGMNAAASLTDFFNKVVTGDEKIMSQVSDNVAAAIFDITEGLEITEADLRDFVSDGLISFEIFSEAMGITFGDHAKDANKTFTGAMANIRAAFARTGAMFVTPLIQQEGAMVELFNAIRVQVNNLNKALAGPAKTITDGLLKVIPQITKWVEKLDLAVYRTSQSTGSMKDQFVGAGSVMQTFLNVAESVWNILKMIGSAIKPVLDAFVDIFSMDSSEIVSASKWFKLVTEDAYSLVSLNYERIYETFSGLFSIISYIVDQLPSLSDVFVIFVNIGEVVFELFRIISSIAEPILAAFIDSISFLFDKIDGGGNIIQNLINKFSIWLKSIELTEVQSQKLYDTFSGLFSIFRILKVLISALFKVFSPLTRLFGVSADNVLSLSGSIGQLITRFADWLEKSEKVNKAIEIMTNCVSWFVDKVLKLADVIGGALFDAFSDVEDIGSYFSEGFLKGVLKFTTSVIKAIFNFGKNCLSALMSAIKAHSPSKETEKIGGYFMEGFSISILELAGTLIDTVMTVFTDMVSAIWDFFKDIDYVGIAESAIEGATTFIENMTTTIVEGIPKVVDGVAAICSAIVEFFTKDNTGENEGKHFISTFISGMWSMVTTLFNSIKTIIVAVFESIRTHLNKEDIKAAWDAGKKFAIDFAQGLIITIKEWLGPISDAFEWVFSKIDFGSLAAIGTGLGVLLLVIKISKSLGTAINPLASLSGVLSSLSKSLSSFAFDIRATAILKIAAAIGILAASIAMLYTAFGEDINLNTLLVVGMTIITLMGFISIIFTKMNETTMKADSAVTQVKSFTDSLKLSVARIATNISAAVKKLASAAAISMVIKAFTSSIRDVIISISLISVMLSKPEYKESFGKSIGIFSAIGGVIAALVSVYMGVVSSMEGTSSSNIKNISIGVAAMAAALLLVAMAIKKLTSIKIDIRKDKSKLVVLAVLLTTLIIVMNSLVKLNNKLESNEGTLKLGLIIGFVALVLAAIHSLKQLIKMGATIGKNYKQLIMLAAIFSMVTLVVKALLKTTKTIGKDEKIANMSRTLFGFCAMVIVTMAAIAILSKMKFTSYIKGLVMVCGVFSALLLVCKAASLVTTSDGYKSLIAMTAIIGVLMIAIGALSMIKTDKLLAGTAALSGALLAFSEVLREGSRYAEGFKASGIVGILTMILAVGVIGYTLYQLNGIPWENLLSYGAAISSVLLALGQMMKDISSIKSDADTLLADIAILGEGIIAILLIGLILRITSHDVNWDEILSTSGAISTAMLAMGKAMKDINSIEANAKDLGKNAIVIIEGLVYMAMVGLILQNISKGIDPLSAVAMAASIGIAMYAMANAIDIMLTKQTVWKDVGMLGGIIGEGLIAIAAIGKTLQEVSQGTDWKSLIGAAVGISLAMIGIAVTALICSPLGKVAKEAGIALLVIDAYIGNLLLVISGLGLLYDNPAARRLLEDGGKMLISLGEALGGFVGGMVNGFLSESSKALIAIGANLSRFMEEAQPFFDALTQLDDSVANKAKTIAAVMLAISTAEFIDGVGRLLNCILFGPNGDADGFGSRLVAFGNAIKEFSESTKDIQDVDHLQKVVDATGAIVDIARNIPNSGGWIENLVGQNDIDDFGKKLVSFASIIPLVAANTRMIDKNDIKMFKSVISAVSDVVKVAQDIPNSGGLIDNIFGENDIDKFGRKLLGFSSFLPPTMRHLRKVTDDDLAKIKPVSESIVALANAASSIPNSGGWLESIFGNNDIDKFGGQLYSYTKSIASVTKIVQNVDLIQGMKDLGKTLKITRKVLVDMKQSFGRYKTLGKHLKGFTDDIILYSDSVKTICNNMRSVSLEILDNVKDSISNMFLIKCDLGDYFGYYDRPKSLKDFLDDVSLYLGSVKELFVNGYAYVNTDYIDNLKETIVKMARIKWDLGDYFGFYEKPKLKSFLTDLSLYLESIKEIFTKQYLYINLDYIENLKKSISEMFLVKYDLSSYFNFYEKTKLKSFLKDLKLYLDALTQINDTMTSTDIATSLTKLSSTISVMSVIKTTFETMGEYTTGKIKKFLKDVVYFADTMVTIAEKDMNNALSNVITMKLSTIYMKDIHEAFINTFAEYSSVNFSWFMDDLKSYASILNYISALKIDNDTLWSLYYMQETFKYINYIRYQIDTLFDKYKVKKFDTFVDDLSTYASALNTITGMNITNDTLWSLYYTQETFKYINYIQYQMSNMFKDYKSTKFDQFISDFNTFVSSMDDLSGKTFDFDKFQELNKMTIILPFIKDRFTQIGQYVANASFNDFCTDFTTLMETMTGILEFNFNDFTAKTTAVADATSRFLNLLPQLSTFEAKTFTDFLRDMIKYGTDSIRGFLAAFNNSKADVDKAISKMFGCITSAITGKVDLTTSAGRIIVKYITDGIVSEKSISRVTESMQEIIRTIMVYVKNNDRGAYLAGLYVVKGFVRGIGDHLHEAEKAGAELGRAALDAAKRSLNENSPSKAMMQIGSYAGEGFVNGLMDWIGAAAQAGTEFGETTLDTMKDAINKLSSEIQNDKDFNPTITPILDLSGIEENANLIGSMLNIDKPIQLAANAGLTFSGGLNNLLESIQAAIPDNDTEDVVDAINDLRSDMAVINQRLTNMQIVMDSGELVGALVEPMDQQMGFNATLVERGVR